MSTRRHARVDTRKVIGACFMSQTQQRNGHNVHHRVPQSHKKTHRWSAGGEGSAKSGDAAAAAASPELGHILLLTEAGGLKSLCPPSASSPGNSATAQPAPSKQQNGQEHSRDESETEPCGQISLTGSECVLADQHGGLLLDLQCLRCDIRMQKDWVLRWTCGG